MSDNKREHLRAAEFALAEEREKVRRLEGAGDALAAVGAAICRETVALALHNVVCAWHTARRATGEPAPVATDAQARVTCGDWRVAIEMALGVEPDPVEHTPQWAHERVLAAREIGNGARNESGPDAEVSHASVRLTHDDNGVARFDYTSTGKHPATTGDAAMAYESVPVPEAESRLDAEIARLSAPGDAEVSRCPGCTSGRAEQCELRDSHAEVSHEQARQALIELVDVEKAHHVSTLQRFMMQQEERQLQSERELKTANHWRERHCNDAKAAAEQSQRNWQEARELSRKLEAAEQQATDYREGARYESARCNTLLAERNRARNETIAALERLEAAELLTRRMHGAARAHLNGEANAFARLQGALTEWDRATGSAPAEEVAQVKGERLTRYDVLAIIAEVAGRACGLHASHALAKLAEAAKETR